MNQYELEGMCERYLKLVDLHGQLQVQNSLLEERVLAIIESYSAEKSELEQALGDAKEQIEYLQETVNELQTEKQRYKDDCNLAVRLLHRYPNEFISTASGQTPEQFQNRYESTSANQPIPSQRSVIMPTFPPSFVAPTSVLMPTVPTINTKNIPNAAATTAENLRRTAETLFKSNSVHRSPSTHALCSDCHRTVKRCDVSVQTSLDDKNNPDTISRIRLVSLTASDDGVASDSAWLSLDSPHTRIPIEEYSIDNTKQVVYNDQISSRSIPRMHHV